MRGLCTSSEARLACERGVWELACKRTADCGSLPVWGTAHCGSLPASERTCCAVPAPGGSPPALRLTRIAPRCPRIAKSHGLFAHSVRVFYAAEQEGCHPGPGMVPHEWNGSLAGKLPQSAAPPAKQAPTVSCPPGKQAPTGKLPPSQASSHPQAPAEPAHNSRPYFFFRACSNSAAIVPV
jgi:hypothetical protein